MPTIEIDCPKAAWFSDSEKKVFYQKLGYVANPGVTIDQLVTRLSDDIEYIKSLSKIIYWRKRPTIDYETDYVPTPEEIESNKLRIRITCRLATFPEICFEQLVDSYTEEGKAIPTLP